MKKKAGFHLSFDMIILFLLGLVVTGVFIYGVYPESRVTIKKMLNAMLPKITTEKDFVPYNPPISGDEQKVLYSITALQCGINLALLGDTDWKNKLYSTDAYSEYCPRTFINPESEKVKENPPEEGTEGKATTIVYCCETNIGTPIYNVVDAKSKCAAPYQKIVDNSKCNIQKKECSGIRYGDVCLECTGEEKAVVEFLNTDKIQAIAQIGSSILSCYGKSDSLKKQINCARLYPDKIQYEITESDIQQWLSQFGGNEGKLIIDEGMLNTGGFPIHNSKSNIEIYTYNPFFSSPKIYLRFFGEKSSVPGYFDIELYTGESDVRFSTIVDRPWKCSISGFELPQKINTLEFLGVGYGDPDYIVFYEQFPRGEEAAWEGDFKLYTNLGMSLIKIGTGAVDITLPFSGKIIKALNFRKAANLKRLEEMGTIGAKTKKVDEKMAEEALKLLAKYGDDGLEAFTRGILFGKESVLAKDIVAELPKAIEKAATRALTNLGGIPLTKEALTDLVRPLFKERGIGSLLDEPQFVESLYQETLVKGGGLRSASKINPKSIAKAFTKKNSDEAIDLLTSTLKKGIVQRNSDVLKLMKQYPIKKLMKSRLAVDKLKETSNALAKTSKELNKFSKEAPESFEAIAKNLDKKMAEIFDEGDYARLFEEMTSEKAADDALKAIANNHIDDLDDIMGVQGKLGKRWIDKLPSAALEKGKGLAKFAGRSTICAAAIPTAAIGIPAAAVAPALVGIPVTSALYAETMACLKAARQAFYPLLVATTLYMEIEDSRNQKYPTENIKNKISVVSPKPYPTSALSFNVDLAENHMVSLDKGIADEKQRFFLASPCKSDIEIYESTCSCKLSDTLTNPNNFVQEVTLKNGRKFWQPIAPPEDFNPITSKQFNLWRDKLTNEQKGTYLGKYGLWFGDDKGIDELSGHVTYERMADTITTILGNDPVKFKEFMLIVAPDSQAFALLFNPVNINTNLGMILTTSDQKIYLQFLNSLIGYLFDGDVSTEFNFEIPGGNGDYNLRVSQYEKSNVERYFKVDFIKQLLHERYWLKRNEDTCEEIDTFSWLKSDKGDTCKSRGEFCCPFDDIKKKWSERRIDYKKLNSYVEYEHSRDKHESIVRRMQAYKLYDTAFFEELAQEASYKIFIYEGDSKDIVKNCIFSEEDKTKQPLGPNEYKLQTTIPCLIINPTNIDAYKDAGWNGNQNYCFTRTPESLKTFTEATEWTGFVLSMASLIPGAQILGVPAGTLTILSGGASLVLNHCSNWPNAEAELSKCKFWGSW